MYWIYFSLTPGMIGRIVEYNIAHDIWASLNQVFESPSIAMVMGLSSQLGQIKKIDISLSEYLAKLKTMFDKYATIGEPLSYRDKLTKTLEGLSEEYDMFVTSINNRSDRPSLEVVHSLLYAYEYRLFQCQVEQNINFSQANLATQNPFFPRANLTTQPVNMKNQKPPFQSFPKPPLNFPFYPYPSPSTQTHS
ncbi:hypothetical protein TorRG33x02_096870 [Trema orientale]|uniref:Uncharacterized protein n=1 Tax=Trema orientale TaxID=63057 RepID=A0A2P5F9H3_TREOI|nr:hypothetical protein TorRG33x02_096870 [Trema orientale]